MDPKKAKDYEEFRVTHRFLPRAPRSLMMPSFEAGIVSGGADLGMSSPAWDTWLLRATGWMFRWRMSEWALIHNDVWRRLSAAYPGVQANLESPGHLQLGRFRTVRPDWTPDKRVRCTPHWTGSGLELETLLITFPPIEVVQILETTWPQMYSKRPLGVTLGLRMTPGWI